MTEPETKTRLTQLSTEHVPFPEGSHVMTALVAIPPGDSGTGPHRHSGPVFAYLVEGKMLFELEGQEPRVIEAGEAFSEPGGDLVHWQAANLVPDAWTRFVAVMVCAPDVPMLTYLTDAEVAQRQALRHPSARATAALAANADVVMQS